MLFAVLFAVIERNSGTYHYDAALTALSITYALKVHKWMCGYTVSMVIFVILRLLEI